MATTPVRAVSAEVAESARRYEAVRLGADRKAADVARVALARAVLRHSADRVAIVAGIQYVVTEEDDDLYRAVIRAYPHRKHKNKTGHEEV